MGQLSLRLLFCVADFLKWKAIWWFFRWNFGSSLDCRAFYRERKWKCLPWKITLLLCYHYSIYYHSIIPIPKVELGNSIRPNFAKRLLTFQCVCWPLMGAVALEQLWCQNTVIVVPGYLQQRNKIENGCGKARPSTLAEGTRQQVAVDLPTDLQFYKELGLHTQTHKGNKGQRRVGGSKGYAPRNQQPTADNRNKSKSKLLFVLIRRQKTADWLACKIFRPGLSHSQPAPSHSVQWVTFFYFYFFFGQQKL